MKKVLHIVLVAGLAMAMLAAKPGPREYANGGATYVNNGNNVVHSSFTAQARGGDAKGQVEVRVESATGDFVQRFHGVVTCLVVNGDGTATIEGIVTQLELSGDNQNTSERFQLIVEDNGEGQAAAADQAGHRRNDAYGDCDGGTADAATHEVVAGNVQVG